MFHRPPDSDPRGDPLLALAKYAEFRRALAESGCRRCALAASRTRIVVDRGNVHARAMAIGEGPGAEEDRQGRAFVGRAGKLLDAMMESVGLDSERDFLIANIVKCRPEGNRAPKRDEAEACLPYLRRQIELVRPRLVALLGRTPAAYLLAPEDGSRPLGDLAGTRLTSPALPGIEIFPLYHPAYILRNPSRRADMERHLEALRRRLRALERESIPWN
jgi:DNA polymerase